MANQKKHSERKSEDSEAHSEDSESFDAKMRRMQEIIDKNPRLKKYVDSGDCELSSRLATMAYLLHTIADDYMQDLFDILARNGLKHSEIQYFSHNYDGAFEKLHRALKARNVVKEYNEKFIMDYERFKAICDDYMRPETTINTEQNGK